MRTGILASSAAVLAALAAPAAAGPLDQPSFTARPAELLAEAAKLQPGDHDIVLLRDDTDVTFDEKGRARNRYRLVFVVMNQSGADDWGTLHLQWAPFYQERPTVRARVIGRGGDVTELDPSLLHDAPAVSESPAVFSDRRELTAPLPRLAPGAVVEEEFIIADREPMLAAGTVSWYGLARGVPIERSVTTISVPTSLAATVVTRGPPLAVKPRKTTAGGRVITTYDVRSIAPADDRPVDAPSDHVSGPAILVATGASWAAVADGYRALVDGKLAAPVTLPPDVRGPTPRATVDKVVAWLHAHVRYTGIELSDSAIIPFAPAETLARGFGDCKDKATLLVALLRAAGITADVALLSTGPGVDVDPALPGLGPFDHAIVRAVVDGKDVWIDATEDLLPAGQLPLRDQGRRALVIAAGTRGLTTTPASAPADNLLREQRTFQLPERGDSRVVEITEPTGFWATTYRGVAIERSRADAREGYQRYVDETYLGTLENFTFSDPRDLTRPFRLTIEASGVGRTVALRGSIEAWLFPADLLDNLPDLLGDDGDAWKRAAAERRVDYVWYAPYTYEVVSRLELPPGHSAPDLPARETRALGTMTLTTTRAREPSALTVTYRLDTGKRRISADDVRAIRAAVVKLRAEGSQRVVFNLDAATLRQQGKMREAVTEYRRLIALHPGESLHHGQLAQAYLAAGLGEAARREARLATTLEPGDGDAWMVLGYVLSRDLFGRLGFPGADRAGAEAAYRKALVLMPGHVGARGDLVTLLTTDELGLPATDLARLREAIALLRAPEGEPLDARHRRLIDLLGRTGDGAALAELATSLPESADRRRAAVTATALLDGGVAAVRQAENLATGDQRTTLLDEVAVILTRGRHYAPLREVRRLTLGGSDPATAASIARLTAADLAALPPAAPETAAQLLAVRTVVGPRRDPPWNAAIEARLAEADDRTRALIRSMNMPTTALADFAIATVTLSTEGDARGGWRIVATTAGGPMILYVGLSKGRAVVLGGPSFPEGVGRSVLERLKAKDLPAARALLRQFLDDVQAAARPTDPAHSLATRHRAELETGPAALLELVAATMLVRAAPAEVAPILKRCAGLTAADDRAVCRRGLLVALVEAGRLADAEAELRAVLAANPDDPLATSLFAVVAGTAGRGRDAIPFVDRALAAGTSEHAALLRARLALADGWPAARPRFEQLVASPTTSAEMLNNVAWTYLYFDTPAAARALIERAFPPGRSDASREQLNTLAAVLAESDEPFAAWERLEQSMVDRTKLVDADWYVLGRIAEGYGLTDDARALYARVTPPEQPDFPPTSWDLAQRRLKALPAPAAPAPARRGRR